MPREICHAVRPTETTQLVASLEDEGTGEREKKALQALKSQMVLLFKNNPQSLYWREASMLSKVASVDEFHGLIFGFSGAITKGTADGQNVDLDLLRYFASFLRWTKHEISNNDARFGAILNGLSKHLTGAEHFNELKTSYLLVCTIGTLLDAMVDIKITGLDREALHGPLKEKLEKLSKSEEPRMSQAATYALQALHRVPDNEGPWEAFFRYGGIAIETAAKISGGLTKMDPEKFVEAGPRVIKLIEYFTGVAKGGKEIWDTREDLKQIIKAMTDVSARRGWYDALRQTRVFVESGAFDGLEKAVQNMNCLEKDEFWCGLYSQLERRWKSDKSSREGIELFIEWTFQQPSLQKTSSKQCLKLWIDMIADLVGKPAWKNLTPRRKRDQILFRSKKTFDPQLRFLPQEIYSETTIGVSHLLEAATLKCREAQLFYADAVIAQSYIKKGLLDIKRLSGDTLPMESCYINLSLIENGTEREKQEQENGFSLEKRLGTRALSREKQVLLQDLFKPRKLQSGPHGRPSRILIRGRAGVGKTTLCKKITHAFLHDDLWASEYDRIIWIPLRKLREYQSFEHYLKRDIFKPISSNRVLYDAFSDIPNDADDSRTLFILDGLDEIIGVQRDDSSLIDCLQGLLNKKNVIITSRPYAVFPARLIGYDVEIETMGFREDQILSYVNIVCKDAQRSQIKDFMAQHWIVKQLMHIPIQLDAVCFIWDEGPRSEKSLTTMTALYQAIELKLWQRDMVRMDRKVNGQLLTAYEAAKYKSDQQVRRILGNEIKFVRSIAFFGIYNNVTEFDWKARESFYSYCPGITDADLDKISFLRSSDSLLDHREQDYYFLHLTFQEYFAAEYFVHCWTLKRVIETVDTETARVSIEPAEFLRQEKYNGRYNIMWRFVIGILQSEGETHLVRFLEQIAGKPRDLLGRTHCRILMHCFNEIQETDQICNLTPLRERFEAELSQMFILQVKKGWPWSETIGQEMEFPEHILSKLVASGCLTHKEIALQSLKYRDYISPSLLNQLLRLFESSLPEGMTEPVAYIIGRHSDFATKAVIDALRGSDYIKSAAVLEGLCRNSTLSQEILGAVISMFTIEDLSPGKVICTQNNLPPSVVQELMLKLTCEDSRVRAQAITALKNQCLSKKGIMDRVVAMINDPDEGVRAQSMWVLSECSNLPDPLCYEILSYAISPDEPRLVRFYTLKALAAQDTLVPDLVERVWQSMCEDDERTTWEYDEIKIIFKHGYMRTDERWLVQLEKSKSKNHFAFRAAQAFLRNNLPPPSDILHHCFSVDQTHPEFAVTGLLLLRILRWLGSVHKDAVSCLPRGLDHAEAWSDCKELFRSLVEYIDSRLQTADEERKPLLLSKLKYENALPDSILTTVVHFLMDESELSEFAAEVILEQDSLSPQVIQSLSSWSTFPNKMTRLISHRALVKSVGPEIFLSNSGPAERASIFKYHADRGFIDRIWCSVKDHYLHVEERGRSFNINIEQTERRESLKADLKAFQMDMEECLGDSWDDLGFKAVRWDSFF